jgi:ArsR family transcriptional regulator, arsenate/arsenite/antimonite-responsive transcriptional repressor
MSADLPFNALADPVRREILAILADHAECSAGELSDRVGSVGRTAVSSHLRVLKTASLISVRRQGRFRYYAVDPDGPVRDVVAMLQQVFQLSLDDTRAALGPAVDQSADRRAM